MMKPVFRDFRTGITALVGLGGLILMLILFGEIADLGQKFYTFNVHVTNASGSLRAPPLSPSTASRSVRSSAPT